MRISRALEEERRMDDEEEEDVMGLLFAANASDDDFVPPSGMARVKARAERSLWTASSTLQKASVLLQVRESRGRGSPSRFRTKLRLSIGSRMTTTISKVMTPIRVRAQYLRLRLLSSMLVPRSAVGRRPQRRHRHRHDRSAATAGASRAGPKRAVR